MLAINICANGSNRWPLAVTWTFVRPRGSPCVLILPNVKAIFLNLSVLVLSFLLLLFKQKQ